MKKSEHHDEIGKLPGRMRWAGVPKPCLWEERNDSEHHVTVEDAAGVRSSRLKRPDMLNSFPRQ